MNREELELVRELDRRIRKIDDTLEVLRKPMLVISSQLTGHVIKINSLDDVTVYSLKTAMIDVLESRKDEIEEQIERI